MPPSWTRPGIKHKRRLGVGKYTNAGWVDFRVPRGYARSIFMKMESPAPSPVFANITRVCASSGKWVEVYSIEESITGSGLLDGQFEIDIFRALSLSIYLSSFFSSFFLSPRFSSSYLEINERKREREGGEKDIKNRWTHTIRIGKIKISFEG